MPPTLSGVNQRSAGTVTFLFTDLEGSTRLWEDFPDAMQDALARHDALLRDAILAGNGRIVKMRGDGVHAVFGSAHDALGAAAGAQRAISAEPWGVTGPLRVRIGVHTGDAELREGDYYGTAREPRRTTDGRCERRTDPRLARDRGAGPRHTRPRSGVRRPGRAPVAQPRSGRAGLPAGRAGVARRLRTARLARRRSRKPPVAGHVLRRTRATRSSRSPAPSGPARW